MFQFFAQRVGFFEAWFAIMVPVTATIKDVTLLSYGEREKDRDRESERERDREREAHLIHLYVCVFCRSYDSNEATKSTRPTPHQTTLVRVVEKDTVRYLTMTQLPSVNPVD